MDTEIRTNLIGVLKDQLVRAEEERDMAQVRKPNDCISEENTVFDLQEAINELSRV